MEDRTVSEWMQAPEDEQQDIALDLAGRIDLGVLAFAQVLIDLQPYLTGDDLPEVALALRLVVTLLNTIQVHMTRHDVHLLVEYFCARLENHTDEENYRAGIKECGEALLALAKMTEHNIFPPGDATMVAIAVFAFANSGNFKPQLGSTRLVLYQLIAELMGTYKSNIRKDIGAKEVIKGLVAMAEFEKDPSCLKLLFSMYAELGRDWQPNDKDSLVMWESFSRYFPITLGGVSKDPSVPKPEELKELLLSCFTSNDAYAMKAFPRLIEMLDQNQDLSANVKNEVFGYMAKCVLKYNLRGVFEWAPKIWDSVKFEVWNGENEDFVRGALEVIHSLSYAVSAASTWDFDDETNAAAQFLSSILKECVERVGDYKRQYMVSTGRILLAIAGATPYSCTRVISKTFPVLMTVWEDLNMKSEKTPLIGIFSRILQARVEVGAKLADNIEQNRIGESGQSPNPDLLGYLRRSQDALHETLMRFKRALLENVYFQDTTAQGLGSPDDMAYTIALLKGLVILVVTPGLLLGFEIDTVVAKLNHSVVDFVQPKDIRDEAVAALQQLSMEYPSRFVSFTLPNFMSDLPSRMATTQWNKKEPSKEIESIVACLNSLMEIACTNVCKVEADAIKVDFPQNAVFDAFQESLSIRFLEVILLPDQQLYANVILAAMAKGLDTFDAAVDEASTQNLITPRTNHEKHPYAWMVLKLLKALTELKEFTNNTSGRPPVKYVGLRVTLGSDPETTYRIVSVLGDLVQSALRSKQTTPINNFLNAGDASKPSQVWSLFCEGAPAELDDTQMNLWDGPMNGYLALTLSMSLVAGVNRTDAIRLGFNVGKVALAMINNVWKTESSALPLARGISLRFLQLLVNKFGALSEKVDNPDRSTLPALPDSILTAHGHVPVETVFDVIKAQVVCSAAQEQTVTPETFVHFRERIYQTLAYVAAAALARCDGSDQELIDLMVKGVSDPIHGNKVSRSFATLLAPSDLLTKENYCIIRPLRNGRLYHFSINKLLVLWRENPDDQQIKTNVLVAIAGALYHMEAKVYLEFSPSLLPLLLEGTNIPNDPFSKMACISTIRTIIPSHPALITSHLDSVISRMTDRTHNTYYSPSDANVEARSAALEVLGLLTKYVDSAELVKRKAKVEKELEVAVDDISSVVRRKAMACKLKWFNVGE